MPKRTLLSWSSGKDSAWTLHVLRGLNDVDVVGLFTTVNEKYDRVAMHAVRSSLLRRQADCVHLPMQVIPIPYPCSDDEYAAVMTEFIEKAAALDVECMAFGDLFLPDVRKYREKMLGGTGLEPIFPLWGADTDKLAEEMIAAGVRAVITCIDPKKLPPDFAGRTYDKKFLADLPDGIDPCGEGGEFHSFVFDAPTFTQPIEVSVGRPERHDGFIFADVVPANSPPARQ